MLVPDEGKVGEGVRLQEVKVTVLGPPLKMADGHVHVQVYYRRIPYVVMIDHDALEDFGGSPNGQIDTDREAEDAAARMLTKIRAIVARKIEAGDVAGKRVRIKSPDFFRIKSPDFY